MRAPTRCLSREWAAGGSVPGGIPKRGPLSQSRKQDAGDRRGSLPRSLGGLHGAKSPPSPTKPAPRRSPSPEARAHSPSAPPRCPAPARPEAADTRGPAAPAPSGPVRPAQLPGRGSAGRTRANGPAGGKFPPRKEEGQGGAGQGEAGRKRAGRGRGEEGDWGGVRRRGLRGRLLPPQETAGEAGCRGPPPGY